MDLFDNIKQKQGKNYFFVTDLSGFTTVALIE